jgi:pyruvate ferredoxin oxidoreductase alpha subunit
MGAFFTPDYYLETREALHNDLQNSLKTITKENKLFKKIFSRDNGLIEYYGPKKPTTILVAMGSVVGTILETIKNNKQLAATTGLLKVKVYRPFPNKEINKIISRAKNIAVIEKAISLGQAGPLYSDLKAGLGVSSLNIKNYIVGLGGRDITQKMITSIIKDAPRKNQTIKFIGK